MATPDNLEYQKYFFMLNRLILKVTKFQLPPPKHLDTVPKNIWGGHNAPPMSNRVNTGFFLISEFLFGHSVGIFRAA